MGLLQDFSTHCILLLCILVDFCYSLTVVSESADVFCDRSNQTAGTDAPTYCQNGGTCIRNGCSCLGGFYGGECQHSVINAVIIIVVCILPPASWTMVFCYGCKERRRKRRLRQERRNQRERSNSTDDYSPTLFADDLPPSYYEIAHTNPIALCSMDEAPYQCSTDGPPPPDYDEVLKKAIECGAILPLQATRFSRISETSQEDVQERPENETSNSVTNASDEEEIPPVAIVTVTDETLPNSATSPSEEDIEENDSPTLPSVIITDGHPVHSSQEDLLASQLDESQQSEASSGNTVPQSLSGLVRKLSKKKAKKPSPTAET